MMHTSTAPTRTRRTAFARAGLAIAIAFGLAACGQVIPDGPTPPGQLTLTGISPDTGTNTTLVTVTGTNIAGNAAVTVGGTAATNVIVRDADNAVITGTTATGTSVSFNPPVLEAGTYDVTVTQGDQSATLENAFTFEGEVIVDPDGAIRVNSGGPQVEFNGEVWLQDQHFFTAGAVYTNPNVTEIAGTDRDAIYLTERNTGSNVPTAEITYVVPVANGTYQVILHFAELFFGHTDAQPTAAAGQRVFNVAVEGQTRNNIDIVDAAGDSATAHTEAFTVDVTDGTVNITITNGEADRGKISGFEIIPVVD